mgnify:CR=1 FL=1
MNLSKLTFNFSFTTLASPVIILLFSCFFRTAAYKTLYNLHSVILTSSKSKLIEEEIEFVVGKQLAYPLDYEFLVLAV